MAGGFLGTLIRAGILEVGGPPQAHVFGWVGYIPLSSVPAWTADIPLRLLVINTVGVFLATWWLAGPLRHRAPDDPVRLLLVTGLLGGLTSYSSLFVSLRILWDATWWASFVVGGGALAAGLLAGCIGLWAARR